MFVVGTGLTTVDVVLADSHTGRSTLHARSRHGVAAAVHHEEGFAPWPGLDLSGAANARQPIPVFREALLEADGAGWGWRM